MYWDGTCPAGNEAGAVFSTGGLEIIVGGKECKFAGHHDVMRDAYVAGSLHLLLLRDSLATPTQSTSNE